MATYYDQITPEQHALIARAPLFFVATADPAMEPGPYGTGPVNLSPKGGVPLQVVDVTVERTATSCGYGVPVLEPVRERRVEDRGRRYKEAR